MKAAMGLLLSALIKLVAASCDAARSLKRLSHGLRIYNLEVLRFQRSVMPQGTSGAVDYHWPKRSLLKTPPPPVLPLTLQEACYVTVLTGTYAIYSTISRSTNLRPHLTRMFELQKRNYKVLNRGGR